MFFYEEIFREFQIRKVKYIVVGGIAVNLLGGMRSTADLDILVKMDSENLSKVMKILTRKGYRLKQPITLAQLADAQARKVLIKNKHMKAVNFYKEGELKEVDIIIGAPVSFEEAAQEAQRVKAGSLTLPVISLEKLIKMKKSTGRAIDAVDIQVLIKVKKLRARV